MSIKEQIKTKLRSIYHITDDFDVSVLLDDIQALTYQLQEPPAVRPASEHPEQFVILWLKRKPTEHEKEGAPFWVRAEYVGKCEREDLGDDESFSVYDEDNPEDDTPYWPEGWYEVAFIHDDYSHFAVNVNEFELLGWQEVLPPKFEESGL